MPRNSSHTRSYNQQQFDELQQTISRMTRVRSHRKKKRSQSRHSSSNNSLLSLSQSLSQSQSSLNDGGGGYSSRSQKESSQQAPLSQRLSQFLERIASPAPAASRRRAADLVSRSAVRPTSTVSTRPSQLDRLEYYSQASQGSCDSPSYSVRSSSQQSRQQPIYTSSMPTHTHSRGNDLDELEILTQPPPALNRYQAPAHREPRSAAPRNSTHDGHGAGSQGHDSFMRQQVHHNDGGVSRGGGVPDHHRHQQQAHVVNGAASVRSSNSTVLESPRPLRDMMNDQPQDIQHFLDSPGSASVSHMSNRQDTRMNSTSASFAVGASCSVSDVRANAASTAPFDSTSNFRRAKSSAASGALLAPTSPTVSVCMSEFNMRYVQGNQQQAQSRPPSVHPAPASTRANRSVSLFGNGGSSLVVPTSAPPKQKPRVEITKPHASTSTLLASASANTSRPAGSSLAGGISRNVPLFGNSARQSPSNNPLSASSRLMEANTGNGTTSSLSRDSTSKKSGSSSYAGDDESQERITIGDDGEEDGDDIDELPETCATQEAEALLPSPQKKKDVPPPKEANDAGKKSLIMKGVGREDLKTELESLKESLVGGLAEMFAKLQEELKSELKRETASSVESYVAKLSGVEESLAARVTSAEKAMIAKCTQVERSFTENLGESQGVLLAKVAESVSEQVNSLGNRIDDLKRDVAGVVDSQSTQLQSAYNTHTALGELKSLGESSGSQLTTLKRNINALGTRVEELKQEPAVARHQVSQSTQTLRVASPPRAKYSSHGCQTTPPKPKAATPPRRPLTPHVVSQCVQTDAPPPPPQPSPHQRRRRLFVLTTPPKPKRVFILANEPVGAAAAIRQAPVALAPARKTPARSSATRAAAVTQTKSSTAKARRGRGRPRKQKSSTKLKSAAAVAPASSCTTRSRSRRATPSTAPRSSLDALSASNTKPVAPSSDTCAPAKRRAPMQKKRVVAPKSKQQDNPCDSDSASDTDDASVVLLPPAKRAKTLSQAINCGGPSQAAKSNSSALCGAQRKRFSALDPPETPEKTSLKKSHITAKVADSPEFIRFAAKPISVTKASSAKSPGLPPPPPSRNVWAGRRGRVTAPKSKLATDATKRRRYTTRSSSSSSSSMNKKPSSPLPQRHLDFDADDSDCKTDSGGKDGNDDDDAPSDIDDCAESIVTSQTSEQAYLDLIQEMRKDKPTIPMPSKYRVRRKRQQHTPNLVTKRRPLRVFAAAMEDSDADDDTSSIFRDPYAASALASNKQTSSKKRMQRRRGAKRKTRPSPVATTSTPTDPVSTSPRAQQTGSPQGKPHAPRNSMKMQRKQVLDEEAFTPRKSRASGLAVAAPSVVAREEPVTGRRSRRATKTPARSFMVSF